MKRGNKVLLWMFICLTLSLCACICSSVSLCVSVCLCICASACKCVSVSPSHSSSFRTFSSPTWSSVALCVAERWISNIFSMVLTTQLHPGRGLERKIWLHRGEENENPVTSGERKEKSSYIRGDK